MLTAWTIMVVSIILIVIFPVNIYFARQIHKMSIVKEIKNKYISWLISFVLLYITIGLLIWNSTNAYIIILHLFFILLIGELIYKIVRKIKKKDELRFGQEITIGSSILFTLIYLSVAYFIAHNVIETHYDVVATKDLGIDSFRVVQITDSHVGATMSGNDFYNYMIKINDTNPDIVVVTGDFIDDDTPYDDFIRSCEGLGALKTKYGVYFVYGNHDKGYFNYRTYTDKDLRAELAKNNVTILEDDGLEITGNIYLLGRQDRSVRDRKSIHELMKDIDEKYYVIDLNHQPNDYKNEEDAKVDLVISGHTHGGQVFPLMIFDRILGANNQVYGIETRGNTTFIVSSGIGDWAVKFKTGTVAEYVVIDIKNK